MKKILFLFFFLISLTGFAQTFNTNVTFNGNVTFKGKTVASSDSIRYTSGGDTLTIGVKNGYAYITCYTCDSIHFYPAVSGSSGGSGTVTSVSVVTNQGVSGTVATATTTPAITLALGALTGVTSFNGLVVTANTGAITTGSWAGIAITPGFGGTGITSYAIGDIPYASGATTLSKLADIATNNALRSGGVGVAPSWGKLDSNYYANYAITMVRPCLSAAGAGLTYNSTTGVFTMAKDTSSIEFIIDGGGSAITTGIKGDIEIPFNCTIIRATMLADQSGSAVVQVWSDTYAAFPPTVADAIYASAPPTITTATKSQDATLTGWTTTIPSGNILRFNVSSVTTITRLTLSLKIVR